MGNDCTPLPPDTSGYNTGGCTRQLAYITRAAGAARVSGCPLDPREVMIGVLNAADVQAVVMAHLTAGRRALGGDPFDGGLHR